MKRHRFIREDLVLAPGTLELDDNALCHQLSSVLRLRPGEEIMLCDGRGNEAVATLESVDKRQVICTVAEVRSGTHEPRRHVTACLALTKPSSFDDAVRMAVECGASAIVPVIAERSVRRDCNLERLRTIAREACEQSGRSVLPMIAGGTPLPQVLQQAARQGNVVFYDMGDTQAGDDTQERTSIFIGPEGGWTPAERGLAMEVGAQMASLGTTILRAETAAAVATWRAAQ